MVQLRHSGRTVAIVLVVALAPVLGAVAPAAATSAQQEATTIDSCTTIDESGTYELNETFRGANATEETDLGTAGGPLSACIYVTASDVTLNGGANLVGGQSSDDGLANESAPNGSAIGGAQSGSVGIAVGGDDVSDVRIENVVVSDWSWGLAAVDATNVTVNDSSFVGNTVGAELVGVSESRLTGVELLDGDLAGGLVANASDVTVSDVRVRDHGDIGLGATDSENLSVDAAEVQGSQRAGLWLGNASETTVADANLSNNPNWAYVSVDDGTDTRATNLSVDDADVSFVGSNVAVGAVEPADDAAAGDGAGNETTGNETNETVTNDLLVTNTSANASLQLSAVWGAGQLPDDAGDDAAGNGTDDGDGADVGNETDDSQSDSDVSVSLVTSNVTFGTLGGNETDANGSQYGSAFVMSTNAPDAAIQVSITWGDGNLSDDGTPALPTDDGNESDGADDADDDGTDADDAGDGDDSDGAGDDTGDDGTDNGDDADDAGDGDDAGDDTDDAGDDGGGDDDGTDDADDETDTDDGAGDDDTGDDDGTAGDG